MSEQLGQSRSGLRLGPLPVPVFLFAALVVAAAAFRKDLSNDLIGGIAVLMLGGGLLAALGERIPVLRHIGGSAILCLFVPSALVGLKIMAPSTVAVITTAIKTDNLLYLYVASLVVGSIFGIHHRVLVQGFLRLAVPFLFASAASVAAGIAAGLLAGYDAAHSFFFIVTPILGGGIGEGVLPLSMAYAEILGRPQGELVASMVPAALVGNVVAILAAGYLSHLGTRRPEWSGEGRLVRGVAEAMPQAAQFVPDLELMGAGLLLICVFFTLGGLLAPLTGIPGPVMMILSVALIKILRIMPEKLEAGAWQMYRFVAVNLTPAILVGLGALYVTWDQLVGALTPGFFLVCATTVLTMVGTGFAVARLMGMYPVDTAIVTACHSGLGGTGDVAILSASRRMELMPFSQMVTRVGGASMVVLAVALMRLFAA